MPRNDKSDEKNEQALDIDTTAPKDPALPYRPGEVASWEGFGAVEKTSDSDAQPPVEPPAEDEPDESFRDPVKEGI